MPYASTIAGAGVIAVLLTLRFMARDAGSLPAILARRALLFLAPTFVVSLLFSLHRYWLGIATDVVGTRTTIGQLEGVIARVQAIMPLHEALRGHNAVALAITMCVLAALAFVRPRVPRLGIGKWAATGAAVAYGLAAILTASAFFGHGAALEADHRMALLQGHVDDIERKASDYKKDMEEEAKEIVRNALSRALDVASLQGQLDAVRAGRRAAEEEIAPYRELLPTNAPGLGSATLTSDFSDQWSGIRRAVDTLHLNRRFVRPGIRDVGRSEWSTLHFYRVAADFRNDRLSRPERASTELQDVVGKIFDVVTSEGGRAHLDAAIEGSSGHPLAPLVTSLVDVWQEPLNALWKAQAEALFDGTVAQRHPYADAAAAARAQVREAVALLTTDLRPGLERLAGGLRRLQGEIDRLPQAYRQLAEDSYPRRLQSFRSTWNRLLGFPAPGARRAATDLRLRLESKLAAQGQPLGKHAQLAAFVRALHGLAGRLGDSSRYQALLQLEQQHLSARAFARFALKEAESRLAAGPAFDNDRRVEEEPLAVLEAHSQWQETHRLAVAAVLDDGESEWTPGVRDRVLGHLALELRFVARAIGENFKPQTYTPDYLKNRVRGYVRLATALEPVALQGVDSQDTFVRNFTGRSGRDVLRFQVVDLIAGFEAELRLRPTDTYQKVTSAGGQLQLVPSATSQQLADILRVERDRIAVFRNRSEEAYLKALSELWKEADRKPEDGARVSGIVVATLEGDSRRMQVPAVGAFRALRVLVQESADRAQEAARLEQELAALETPDAVLEKALAGSRGQFLWLQEQIRHESAKLRRQLHIRAANRAR